MLRHFFGKTLKIHICLTVRAFDLIPKPRARPKYDPSSYTTSPHVLLIYLMWLSFFCLNQPPSVMRSRGFATVNHCQSGYDPNDIKGLNSSKKACFWQHQKIFATNYLRFTNRHNWIRFLGYSHWNYCFFFKCFVDCYHIKSCYISLVLLFAHSPGYTGSVKTRRGWPLQ